jgi:hypothetical protein
LKHTHYLQFAGYLRRVLVVVIVSTLLVILSDRLPAPIQEASETPTPTPSATVKPQPKSKVKSVTTKTATSTLAETNLGFDGTWVGEESIYKTMGNWVQRTFQPTFMIAKNGTLVGRLNGPAAGRFDHVVLKDGTLYFGAGNTTFELRLSTDGKTLNEMMHVVVRPNWKECWLTGHYHRQ